MNKQLSIIIVTYNSEKLIFECLESIYKYNDIGDNLEIIVVDNCSKNCDNIFKKIQAEFSNDIRLIKSNHNHGYGAGNNLGNKYANSPYFVVMNPDVRIVEPIFNKILNILRADLNIGLLGVKFIDGSNHLYYKPEYENLFNMIFGNTFIKLGFYNVEKMYFSGSFLVFNKEIFIESGGFDENLFLFYEEADISNRILGIKKKTLLANDLFVLHLIHGRAINKNLLKIGIQSRQYYFNKYNIEIDKYYKRSLIMWRLKYIAASILFDSYRKEHFRQWINLCLRKGEVL